MDDEDARLDPVIVDVNDEARIKENMMKYMTYDDSNEYLWNLDANLPRRNYLGAENPPELWQKPSKFMESALPTPQTTYYQNLTVTNIQSNRRMKLTAKKLMLFRKKNIFYRIFQVISQSSFPDSSSSSSTETMDSIWYRVAANPQKYYRYNVEYGIPFVDLEEFTILLEHSVKLPSRGLILWFINFCQLLTNSTPAQFYDSEEYWNFWDKIDSVLLHVATGNADKDSTEEEEARRKMAVDEIQIPTIKKLDLAYESSYFGAIRNGREELKLADKVNERYHRFLTTEIGKEELNKNFSQWKELIPQSTNKEKYQNAVNSMNAQIIQPLEMFVTMMNMALAHYAFQYNMLFGLPKATTDPMKNPRLKKNRSEWKKNYSNAVPEWWNKFLGDRYGYRNEGPQKGEKVKPLGEKMSKTANRKDDPNLFYKTYKKNKNPTKSKLKSVKSDMPKYSETTKKRKKPIDVEPASVPAIPLDTVLFFDRSLHRVEDSIFPEEVLGTTHDDAVSAMLGSEDFFDAILDIPPRSEEALAKHIDDHATDKAAHATGVLSGSVTDPPHIISKVESAAEKSDYVEKDSTKKIGRLYVTEGDFEEIVETAVKDSAEPSESVTEKIRATEVKLTEPEIVVKTIDSLVIDDMTAEEYADIMSLLSLPVLDGTKEDGETVPEESGDYPDTPTIDTGELEEKSSKLSGKEPETPETELEDSPPRGESSESIDDEPASIIPVPPRGSHSDKKQCDEWAKDYVKNWRKTKKFLKKKKDLRQLQINQAAFAREGLCTDCYELVKSHWQKYYEKNENGDIVPVWKEVLHYPRNWRKGHNPDKADLPAGQRGRRSTTNPAKLAELRDVTKKEVDIFKDARHARDREEGVDLLHGYNKVVKEGVNRGPKMKKLRKRENQMTQDELAKKHNEIQEHRRMQKEERTRRRAREREMKAKYFF